MALHNVSIAPIAGEMHSINPATGELMRSFAMDSNAALERKLQRAAEAFASWRNVPFAERSRMLLRAAAVLESDKHELARTMTLEMGKPIRAAVQ